MELFKDFILFDESDDWKTGNELLYVNRLTDGLPVVLPTMESIRKMIRTVSDQTKSYGKIPPGMRELTPANVAYHAVMAGCKPDEFPIVLTAVVAALDPRFNLLGIQTTTGTTTTAVVVHGPIIKNLEMNSQANCLGPGNRSNACIGRAVRLALTNLGVAYPGTMDMATMGQPGKYTFCFAESTKQHPIPFLPVRKGLEAGTSAVTIIGVSGTIEVYDMSSKPMSIMETLVSSMKICGNVSSAHEYLGSGELFILLPPEVVNLLDHGGWALEKIQQYIFEEAAIPADQFSKDVQQRLTKKFVPIAKSPAHIYPIITGGVGAKMTLLQTWAGGTESITLPILA
jgi:hypothetical protein